MAKIVITFLLSLGIINTPNLSAEIALSKAHDGVYFILEKIDQNNIKDWLDYATAAEALSNQITQSLYFIEGVIPKKDESEKNLEKPIKDVTNPLLVEIIRKATEPIKKLQKVEQILFSGFDGLTNFKSALQNAVKTDEDIKSDVWVAYISTKNPASYTRGNDKTNDIEMAMAVLVKAGSPLVMHMGIARNPFYLVYGSAEHARISPRLHAFAAKVVLAKYQSPKFLITTPLGRMADLFKEVLPKDQYAEGMNKDGTWIIRDHAAAIFHYDDFRFKLFDRDIKDANRELVLSLDNDNKKPYSWLFLRLHASLERHPYFAAKLAGLASLFPESLVLIP